MGEAREFSVEPVRTDGWFDRIGEGISSFDALCEIMGARFFAFAMITGARITALTVDRRQPDNTVVDFVVGAEDEELRSAEPQRLPLGEFRRRLVGALVQEEPIGSPPVDPDDLEALQRHIGVRYLLLAPLFGYQLRSFTTDGLTSRIEVLHEGELEGYHLTAFRARLRTHVREELDRVTRGQSRGSLDLARVGEALEAAAAADWQRVVELLGAWPAPLSMFLRTAEGQMLAEEARSTIARGLAALGQACVQLGDAGKGEEILRLAIQYALEGEAAAEVYLALGEVLLDSSRAGEAIGPLRRAATLGANPERLWLALARAFSARKRRLAALGALERARQSGAEEWQLRVLEREIQDQLGRPLESWRAQVSNPNATESGGGPKPSTSGA